MAIDTKKMRAELKQRRLEQKKTLETVAKACGVTKSAVLQWEKGVYVPGFDRLNAWGKCLGVDVNLTFTKL